MTWTPLITSSAFTGIQTDVGTVIAGIIAISLSILGVRLILSAFGAR